jgi:hypothetical protein
MSRDPDPTVALLRAVSVTARGPRREGAFALWLTTRVALDLARDDPPGERAHRRRVTALERRLSSLTLPAPIRRALQGALLQLREGAPDTAATVLAQLVAPARESLGPEPAQLLAQAARMARRRVGDGPGA